MDSLVEPYPHRWIIRDPQGRLVAHIGLPEKRGTVGRRTLRIGGIAEVCVYPECRACGYVKAMLACVHDLLRRDRTSFSVLYGGPMVYGSSGYVEVDNLAYGNDQEGWHRTTGMVRPVSDETWLTGEVRIPGKKF